MKTMKIQDMKSNYVNIEASGHSLYQYHFIEKIKKCIRFKIEIKRIIN